MDFSDDTDKLFFDNLEHVLEEYSELKPLSKEYKVSTKLLAFIFVTVRQLPSYPPPNSFANEHKKILHLMPTADGYSISINITKFPRFHSLMHKINSIAVNRDTTPHIPSAKCWKSSSKIEDIKESFPSIPTANDLLELYNLSLKFPHLKDFLVEKTNQFKPSRK